MEQVRSGTGRIIDSVNDIIELGGWPTYASAEPPTDSSGDGMPDEWKIERGLDPNAFDAHGDRNGDGYTNLEEYLHFAHEQVPGRYGAGAGR